MGEVEGETGKPLAALGRGRLSLGRAHRASAAGRSRVRGRISVSTEKADSDPNFPYWNAIVGNGGQESACGWCKDKWGLSWQITPRVLTDAMKKGGDVAKRAFEAMLEMKKIDVAKIEAAVRGANR